MQWKFQKFVSASQL